MDSGTKDVNQYQQTEQYVKRGFEIFNNPYAFTNRKVFQEI